MSRTSRQRQRERSDLAVDGVEAVGHLVDLGPLGLGIAVFGGAVAVVAGVFTFMSRRF